MEDAFATADAIASDWGSAQVPFLDGEGEGEGAPAGWEGVKRETGVDNARVVDWMGWRKIDGAERERGRLVGKEREKFTRTADMLAVLG
jgi:adrenodoxin-NADP+ reductase